MFWRSGIDPDVEPARILILRGEFIDSSRNGRTIPYKLYYPVDDGGGVLPVIIWSHGLGGNRDGAGFISRFLASYGYIILHIQHRGTDSSLWEGKIGHPWDAIRAAKIPRKTVLERYRDVPFVLDQLPALARDNAEIGARLDLSRIGMSGHSFGANTTQIMAGQKLGYGRRQYRLCDSRFSCGVLYSPVPSYNRKDPGKDIYGSIAIPLFHMTGTDDTSPVEGFSYTRRLEVFDNSGGPDQHLLILKDGDHMVYNGSRGKLGDNPKREIHETLIKISALAFWDAYLKKDTKAAAWLQDGGLAQYVGLENIYRYKA